MVLLMRVNRWVLYLYGVVDEYVDGYCTCMVLLMRVCRWVLYLYGVVDESV